MRTTLFAAAVWAMLMGAPVARAQSIEPRAYSPAPTGVNFFILGYIHSRGGLSFDESAPLKDPKLSTGGPVAAYGRTFGLWGRAAKFDVIVPTTQLKGTATYLDAPVSREIDGFFDPLMRVSVNLYGAPAMDAAEFRSYKQDVVVGASVQISAPLGQYDETRLVNLSTHRWTIRPEMGVSKQVGRWVFEFAGGATFFTTNDDFFGGNTRRQRPIWAARSHAIYNIRPGAWVSVDGTFYTGGRTKLNGVAADDRLENWRLGATLTVPVDARSSIKFNASRGVASRTGNSFDLVGAAWQYRWGGGT